MTQFYDIKLGNMKFDGENNTEWSKVSVYLTIKVQSSGAQRLFDCPLQIHCEKFKKAT